MKASPVHDSGGSNSQLAVRRVRLPSLPDHELPPGDDFTVGPDPTAKHPVARLVTPRDVALPRRTQVTLAAPK